MTPIQHQIELYIGGKSKPSERDFLAFVGMAEAGEADAADFYAVGGLGLVADVSYRKGYMDGRRDG